MTKPCHGRGPAPNRRADKCSADFSWRDLLVGLWPANTAAYVASFTRTKVRAAEHVLEGRNGLGGTALINLLRSPHGPAVLDAILGDVPWRETERRLMGIAALERDLENKKRQLEQLREQVDGRA